jgi:uncharacterized protein with ParB-like and HNH nuclease domain
MEPTNQTFQELVANGIKYTVPIFQRNYAWDQEQWEDLWADIETLKDEHYHYMGYIVLQQKGQYDFKVIDGQQRLVTLSLIILAAMRTIQDLIDNGEQVEKNKERLREITARFIGSKDLVSLKVSSKLSLNRNNNRFYKDICSLLKPPNPRGLIASNKLLKKAFEFLLSKPIGNTGSEIAAFIERFTSGMVFTKIVVQDDLNAYKVFETLNSRGVQLSTPDLLKNYIFSIITSNDDVMDEKLDDLDEEWSVIVSQLGENNFTEFIHYHHNFQKKSVVLSIRYNVICRNSPIELENLYNQIAIKIFNQNYVRASHVKNCEEFRKLYPENNAFFNAFEFHKISSRQSSKKIRFLLAEIESYLDHKVDYTKTSLEHICPYHPEQTIKDRLGNMVLLEKDELKRSDFKEKKQFYLNTPFALAKKIAEYNEWNLQNLNDYQAWLAEQAVNTWRLDIA